MKKMGYLLLALLFVLCGCSNTNKTQETTITPTTNKITTTTIDPILKTELLKIYQKGDIEEEFDNWLMKFDSFDISFSDNYTYVIGSKDTKINIFDYQKFELKDNTWYIDDINTHIDLYDNPNLDNLYIEYGDNGNWFINGIDTKIEIEYRNFTVKLNTNGVEINETINLESNVQESTYFNLPAISSTQYIFVGWCVDNSINNMIGNQVEVNRDLNIYAIWEHPYLEFELNVDSEYVVKMQKADAYSLYIPNSFNGKKVVGIYSNAFNNTYQVKKIYIPESIEFVNEGAFSKLFGAELIIPSKNQTLVWNERWRDESSIQVTYLNGDKDDYYDGNKDDVYYLSDYFNISTSGQVPYVTNGDAYYNREFYYWSSGVSSTQNFTSKGMVINITSASNISSYQLQFNDLQGSKPISVGTLYTVSFSIKPNKENTRMGICLSKKDNSHEFYYQEYDLEYNVFNNITFSFTAEDSSFFMKLYLGGYVASYTIKDFKIGMDYVNYIKSEIGYSIPSAIYETFTLPTFNDSDVLVEYNSDYTTIDSDNQFIYLDPEESINTTIEAVIHYKGKTYYSEYNARVKSPIIKIPAIYITLNNTNYISQNDNYTEMSLTFIEYDSSNKSNILIDEVTGGIRVRGNSTSTFIKKPYRIKLDSKCSFFGLQKAKSWVLLANHADQSLMRDYLAYNLGKQFDNMAFSPSAYYVDLYVNNEYYGNYILCEQMQVNKGRVDIESVPGEVDTGYLIEYDFHKDDDEVEGVDYFYDYNSPNMYFVKSPDRSDGLTDEQFNYIKSYISSVDTAIRTRNGYMDLIDIDSFVDFFWLQEIFKNVDCNQGSLYMYKEKGGKLYMGPIWDFDLSAGDDGQDAGNAMPSGWYSFLNYKNQWWYNLMKEREVVALFKARWHEKYQDIVNMVESIPLIYDYIEDSANRNFEKYDIIGKEWEWYTIQQVYDRKTYAEQVDYLYNWLKDRVEWINNNVDLL